MIIFKNPDADPFSLHGFSRFFSNQAQGTFEVAASQTG